MEVKMEMAVDDLMTEDEKSAFQQSAQICIARSAGLQRIAELLKKCSVTYLSEEEFMECHTRIMTWRLWVYLVMVIGFASLLSYPFRTSSESVILLITFGSFFLSAFVYQRIRKMDLKRQKRKMQDSYEEYRQEEVLYDQQKIEWRAEVSELRELVDTLENLLLRLRRAGGIHQDYWDNGYHLWHYVEVGRARNLREAVNLFEEDKQHYEMLQSIRKVSEAQATMYYQNLQMQRQLESMRNEMDYLALRNEINNDINTALTILALRD